MANAGPSKEEKSAALFFWILKSLNQFNTAEVKGVVDSLISPTDHENCFVGTYYRAIGNVETLISIQNSKGFQAIAMLSRALFELAVDIRLLNLVEHGSMKMLVFVEVEKLRCARKIVKFKAANPTISFNALVYEAFINANEKSINGKHAILWPEQKHVEHWSGMRMKARVALLKAPFDEIYEINYPMLSWYVHSGLTGVVNLKAEAFVNFSAQAFKLAADAYWEIILTMIREFKIGKADDKIEKKLEYAKKVPLTDSPEQAEDLLRALLG